MPDSLEKLRPDRDLQCFFFRPSAIAAMSYASPTGFTVSGSWRQQFDWTVIEWNQHNVFEHPAFRYLPDGDLSGLVLTYEETRENCIRLDSDLFPTIDWDKLRVWTRNEETGEEHFHRVPLHTPAHSEAIEGSYVAASAEFTLSGMVTAHDHIGIGCLGEGWDYEIASGDSLADAVAALANIIDTNSIYLAAEVVGTTTLKVHYRGAGATLATSTTGANGNRVGAYVYVQGAETETWSSAAEQFSGGESPTKWRVTIDFSSLFDEFGDPIDTEHVRKMRWTYAADLQPEAYERTEFKVELTNWTVTGTGRGYQVAGPQSFRIEDTNTRALTYSETVSPLPAHWTAELGNYSGGTLRYTNTEGAWVTAVYEAAFAHTLYLGTRFLGLASMQRAADITVEIDGGAPRTIHLWMDGEDQLVRLPLAELGAGNHTVTITHATANPIYYFYFDFLEVCVPTADLPVFPIDTKVTLATDWDTDHSIAIAPERTAWFVNSLGYHGRANHYVGALWFYEMHRPGQVYASATFEFVGTPPFSSHTKLYISSTEIDHTNLIGDTGASIAKAFEQVLNQGSNAVHAVASGNVLTLYARQMGFAGNAITISATPDTGSYHVVASGSTLAGGDDGDWRTDLASMPRINRAARDWSKAYYEAMAGYGITVTAAFSTELQHGDPSVAAGIAQRYPNGDPVLVNTPALQTNFSPTSLAYWQQVHLEMAQLMVDAGLDPYLQFGEVQWWYFPLAGVGMTFYDEYTTDLFEATYSHPMATIVSNDADPALYPDEAEFLPQIIGAFTNAAAAFVAATFPDCKFEVLYPLDVNDFAFTRVINYAPDWNAANLDTIKTESFGFTFGRNLDMAKRTIDHGDFRGFPRNQRSFLVGVQDGFSSWQKEVEMAKSQNLESIVLWALDQYCLVGYPTPLPGGLRRASEFGV